MMDKKGSIIDEYAEWIIAAVLLFILLVFLMSIPLSKWISYFPDYNYGQNDTYIGDIAPDFELPSGEVRYCPGKIEEPNYQGVSGVINQYNPFSNPVQYISFWNFNTKKHEIKTSFYLKGNSEEGVIYFKEAEDIAIADVVNGAVLLKPEILDATSRERYLIWFNFLSNKPKSFSLEFLVRLASLDKSIIYSGNYICHPDNWQAPMFSDFWPPSDNVIFINSIEQNGKEYRIDLSPYFDAEDYNFEYFYVKSDKSIFDFNDNKVSFQGYYLTVYGKKLGWFGVDWFSEDKPMGIILRDGSILISPQILNNREINKLFDSSVSIERDSIANQLSLNYSRAEPSSYTLRYFYRTNLYVSESKVSELFNNLK